MVNGDELKHWRTGERSVSERFSEYVVNTNYSDLNDDAIREAKTLLLDVFSTAIVGVKGSGAEDDAPRLVMDVVGQLGGPQESTIIGGGKKAWCAHAALINGVSMRYPEYPGHLLSPYQRGGAIHCEENIPACLAVAEKTRASGKDLITAIVLAAEVHARLGEIADQRVSGFHHTTRGIYSVPMVVGKLLGLTVEQVADAVGISGSFGLTLDQLHAAVNEPTSPTRNLAFPLAAHQGILGALLAQRGYRGPREVIEGGYGYLRALGVEGVRARARLNRIVHNLPTAKTGRFMITYYGYKLKAGDMITQCPADVMIDLRRDHEIDPEEVREVRLYMKTDVAISATIGTHEANKYPRWKEMADHSVWYTVARALLDGDLQFPEQFTPAKIRDPRVRDMIDRIKIYGDPKLDEEARGWHPDSQYQGAGGPVYAEVQMEDGKTVSRKNLYIHGYGPERATPKQVTAKFENRASLYIAADQRREIMKTVEHLDELDDVGSLMALLRSF
jgi:2-methylcitrate dehydratase